MVASERIATNVAEVRRIIAEACAGSGRDPSGVTLVAVTKSQDPDVLPALRSAGVRDFGENRLDHLDLMRLHAEPGDRWHFIGRIQGRQISQVLERVHALHSLADPGHIERLARGLAGLRVPPDIYVLVNTSGEASKSGIAPVALPAMLAALRARCGISPAGLMTMAPDLDGHADDQAVRRCFAALRSLTVAHGLPGLSMGMSGDLVIAVEEGATIVRVGSRLFA